jgi:hypothetical protein
MGKTKIRKERVRREIAKRPNAVLFFNGLHKLLSMFEVLKHVCKDSLTQDLLSNLQSTFHFRWVI